jgi:hypothetical protein
MSTSPSSSLSSRARNAAVVVALVAVGLAARNGEQQPAPAAPPTQPPAAPVVPDSAVADSAVAGTDSLLDSAAVAALDSMTAAMEAKAAEVTTATAPAAWPVDATTGQTLINGRPVVGRVFIMRKTDGTVKYPNVADVISHEALAPLPAVVGSSYTQAPLTHQRRMRGVMIQSTLWDMDTKRSAVRQRYYPASTPANQLGQ